jgi:outer membrane protein
MVLLAALGAAALVTMSAGPAAADTGAIAAAQSAPGAVLDVAALLRLAAEQSGPAALAAAEERVAAAAIRRATAGWWPRVSFDAQYTSLDNPVEATAGPARFMMAEQNSGQYALTARELLWDGGKRHLAVSAARQGEEAVTAAGEADVLRAQLQALDAYLGALELAGNSRVLGQRLSALRAHLGVVHDLYDQGLVARNDLLETEVRVREVEDAIQAVEHHRAIARGELNRRLGRDPETPLALPDSLPRPPALSTDRDALLSAAAEDNAVLKAAAARLEAGRTVAKLQHRAWTPSLYLALSHSWQENDALVHPFVNAVTAGVTWDIFDGGVRQADVLEAEARITSAARDLLETQRAIAVALDSAWRELDQAGREERTARANEAASLENLRIVEDQYRAGLARSSDVLDAEALLAASRHDVVIKHYATYRAQAGLLAAAGRDLVAFYAGGDAAVGEH